MTWKKLNKARSKRTKSRHKWRTTRGSKKRVTSQSHLQMRWKRILDRPVNQIHLVRMKTRRTLDLTNKRSFRDLTSRRSFLDPMKRKRLTARLLKLHQLKIFQLEIMSKISQLHLTQMQILKLSPCHSFSIQVILMLVAKKKYWTNPRVTLSLTLLRSSTSLSICW